MAEPPLYVYAGSRLVGRLVSAPLSFAYEPSWLTANEAFQLSVSLPLRSEAFGEAEVRAFFFNLLPEGSVRRRLAGRLKISQGNDYALLAAVGGECAGALEILPGPPDAEAHHEYAPLSDSQIAQLISSGGP